MAAADNPIIHGATITELAALFGMDRKDIRIRIGSIPPSGNRMQSDVWRVRDVAAKLVKLGDDHAEVVARVLAMNHTDLPKMLSKEYWYGQNQRLKYLREVGDLWDTAAIVTLAGDVFKTLRLSLMLASDAVERETGLTGRQREIIENLMHEALNDAREKLVVSLNALRENTGGKTFAPPEVTSGNGRAAGGEPRPGDDDYI